MRTVQGRSANLGSGTEVAVRTLRLLVHANVVIALAAAGVAITSFLLLDVPIEPLFVGFAFGASFIAYTLNRVWDRAEDASNVPDRAAFVARHGRRLVLLAGVGYGLAAIRLAMARPTLALFAWVPPVAAWAYSIGPVKRTLLAKNVFVGLVWACIPLGIGLAAGQVRHPTTLLTAGLLAWMLTIAAVLFDIKDVDGDRLAGVRTLPTVVGVARTRQLAAIGLLGAIPAILWGAVALRPAFLVFLGYVGYLAACVPFARTDRGVLFYGLVIDGEHVVVGAAAGLWLLMAA